MELPNNSRKVFTLQASKTSFSASNDITSTPTIGAHDFRVKTLRIKGRSSPCRVTRLAIYQKELLSITIEFQHNYS